MLKKTLMTLGVFAVTTLSGCIIVPPRPPVVVAPVGPGAVVVAPVPVPLFGFWERGWYGRGYYGGHGHWR
jgi:hypothetical protein